MILNRAKFAEWLRAPQRGSGKWPYLYSDKNYHLVKRDTRKKQTSPMLMPPGPPPLHQVSTTSTVEPGASLFKRVITSLHNSLPNDTFSRATMTTCAASIEKHTRLPHPSPSECPKALSLESGQEVPGLGLSTLPQQGPSIIGLGKAPWCTKTSCILGLPLHPPPITCAKLKQCVVLACFILFKKSLPPSLPLCLKCLYKFLFKQ